MITGLYYYRLYYVYYALRALPSPAGRGPGDVRGVWRAQGAGRTTGPLSRRPPSHRQNSLAAHEGSTLLIPTLQLAALPLHETYLKEVDVVQSHMIYLHSLQYAAGAGADALPLPPLSSRPFLLCQRLLESGLPLAAAKLAWDL